MINGYRNRMRCTINIVLAVLFAMSCSTSSSTSHGVAIEELNIEKSRQIAEDFIRTHPAFAAHNGQNLSLIAEETLRCPLCWVFDFRYVVLVNGKPLERYVTVTVQEGKASLGIPEKEGMPPNQ